MNQSTCVSSKKSEMARLLHKKRKAVCGALYALEVSHICYYCIFWPAEICLDYDGSVCFLIYMCYVLLFVNISLCDSRTNNGVLAFVTSLPGC